MSMRDDRYNTYKGGNVDRKIEIKALAKGFVVDMENTIGFPVGGKYAFGSIEEMKKFLRYVINDLEEDDKKSCCSN